MYYHSTLTNYTMNQEFQKNWDTQLKKGLLPFFVLHTLEQQEYYGYELIQTLKEQHGLETTESTMYPLLVRMMKEGLLVHNWVEQTSGIPRKYYHLTDEGKSNLTAMRSTILQLFSDISTKEAHHETY
jgi:PadR family transcriptional regulator, regulatory protein PadR